MHHLAMSYSVLTSCTSALQANKAEADPVRASDQLKELYARISFLRMATPRIPRDRFFRGGAGSFVLRDGELVPGSAAKDKRCSLALPRQVCWAALLALSCVQQMLLWQIFCPAPSPVIVVSLGQLLLVQALGMPELELLSLLQGELSGVCGRVADGKISMDEAYRKHNQLLKRQHFGREPPKVRQMF